MDFYSEGVLTNCGVEGKDDRQVGDVKQKYCWCSGMEEYDINKNNGWDRLLSS